MYHKIQPNVGKYTSQYTSPKDGMVIVKNVFLWTFPDRPNGPLSLSLPGMMQQSGSKQPRKVLMGGTKLSPGSPKRLGERNNVKPATSWWFFSTQLKNILVKFHHFPIFGVKVKIIWVATT